MSGLHTLLTTALQESKISQVSHQAIQAWLTDPEYQDFICEIEGLIKKEDWATLDDSFRTTIPFGTGGRRGPRGVGPNRINERTIGESAQGLASYITKLGDGAKTKGVVIAYDTRIKSKEFAQLVTEIFAGNGIKAYLFDGPRATPELSFVIRHLKTQAGVVISASHNPPTDNGFKAYNHAGGQIIPPEDAAIMAEVKAVTKIKRVSFDKARADGLIDLIGKPVDEVYWQTIQSLTLRPTRSAKIIYSPLHGAGSTNIIPVLQRLGFSVEVVKEQTPFDGQFSTCPNNIPNPEVPSTMALAIEQATKQPADVVIVSDPDADRIGVAAPGAKGDWAILTGNQVGAIVMEYLGWTLKELNQQPAKGVVVETVVTSRLIGDIAQSYGYRVVNDLLVGFKYIANVIEHLPKDEIFKFGAEESLGYLLTGEVRDKDAAQGALIVAECTSWLKDQGKTLTQFLDEIYQKYGYYREILHTETYTGAQGSQKIKEIMHKFRDNPPKMINGLPVIGVTDRSVGQPPHDNLLIFHLSDDGKTRLAARPSGTEPKIKFYISCYKHIDQTSTLSSIKKRVDDQSIQLLEYTKGLKEKGDL